jgi:hypothetical protein
MTPAGSVPDPQAEAARVAASARFQKAPVLRDLLLYLARRGTEPTNEYAVGVDVLGRRADFDPKTDSSVRVHMGRLRQRLRDYYENEGQSAGYRLSLPAGSYQIQLDRAEMAPSTGPAFGRQWKRPAMIAIGAVAIAGLIADNVRLRLGGSQGSTPPLDRFWADAIRPGSPVTMIVPAPLFFQWPSFVARDFFVNAPADFARSSPLRELKSKLGEPEVSQLYTVASDTLAVGVLSRYLHDRAIPTVVRDTSAVSIDMLGAQSALLMVGPGSVVQAEELLAGMNFSLKSGTRAVLNRNPAPGEKAVWSEAPLAPLRTVSYGIVARRPGKERGTELVLLASRHNNALAAMLTSASELEKLETIRRNNGSPRHFEAVVEYEQNAEKVLRAKWIAFRAGP